MRKYLPSILILLFVSVGVAFFIAASGDSLHVYDDGDSTYTVQLLTRFLERLPLSFVSAVLLVCGLVALSSLIVRFFVNKSFGSILRKDISTLLPLLPTLLIPLRYIEGLGEAYPYLFIVSCTLQPALLALGLILSVYLKLVRFGMPWLHGNEQGRLLSRLTSNSIAIGIFIILSIFYLLTTPLYLDNAIFAGDQPHYLVVTHSLLEDGDIYIEDDHLAGVVDEWTPIHTEPQFFQRTVDGQIIPFHRVGLPILALLPYWLFGKTGAVVLMGLLSALSAALIYRLSETLTGHRRASLWATAFVSLTTPVLLLSYQFFSEVPAATITLLVLNMIIRREEHAPPRWPWLIPFIIWTLPWMHARDMITAVALTAFLVVRMRSSMLARAGVLLLSFILAMGIPVFNYAFYGTFSLVAEMGGDKGAFGLMNVVQGLGGLFFDQEFGLLLYNPGILLIFPGLLSLFRSRPGITIWLIVIAGFSAGPNLLYRMWWGGGSVPGRYYVAVLHLAAIPIAKLLSYHRRTLFRRMFLLAFMIAFVFAVFMLMNPETMVNDRDGTAKVLTTVSAHTIDAVEWVPSWFSGLERSWLLAGLSTLFAAVIALLVVVAGRLLPLGGLSTGPGALSALAIVIVVAGIYTPLAEMITPGEPNAYQPTSHEKDRLLLDRYRHQGYSQVRVMGEANTAPLPPLRYSAELIYGAANLSADEKAARNRSKLLSPHQLIPFYSDEPFWRGQYVMEINVRSETSAGSLQVYLESLGQPMDAEPLAGREIMAESDFKTYTMPFTLETNSPGLQLRLETSDRIRFHYVKFRPEKLTTVSEWPYPLEFFDSVFWDHGEYRLITDGIDLFRPHQGFFWTWGDYTGQWHVLSSEPFNALQINVRSRPGITLTLESDNDGALVDFSSKRNQSLQLKPVVIKHDGFWSARVTVRVAGHFIPAEEDPQSTDTRKLGVQFNLRPVQLPETE